MKKQSNYFFTAILAVSSLFMISSCEEVFSDAKAEASEFKLEHDFGVLNDEADAGVTMTFKIKNIGEKGVIKITPKLSCSEGEWTREQTLSFSPGETKSLTYFFHEPTINAANIQGSVNAYPN